MTIHRPGHVRSPRLPGTGSTTLCIVLCALLLATLAAGSANAEEAAARDEARELLEETLRSRGGVEEMGRLREIRRQGELVIATREGEKRLPLLMMVRPPQDLVFQTGEGEQLVRRELVAGKGWETRGDGPRRELNGEETADLLRLVQVDEALLALSALAGDLAITGVEDAGPGQVDPALPAAAGRAILVHSPDGKSFRLVVPAGGGLPLRVDYRYGGEAGEDDQLSEVFTRWRIVDGLLFPAEVVLFKGAQAPTAAHYETISVDLEAAPAP